MVEERLVWRRPWNDACFTLHFSEEVEIVRDEFEVNINSWSEVLSVRGAPQLERGHLAGIVRGSDLEAGHCVSIALDSLYLMVASASYHHGELIRIWADLVDANTAGPARGTGVEDGEIDG